MKCPKCKKAMRYCVLCQSWECRPCQRSVVGRPPQHLNLYIGCCGILTLARRKQKDEIARLKKVPEQMAAHLVSAATDWMLKMDFAPDYRFNLVFYLAQEAKKFRSW